MSDHHYAPLSVLLVLFYSCWISCFLARIFLTCERTKAQLTQEKGSSRA